MHILSDDNRQEQIMTKENTRVVVRQWKFFYEDLRSCAVQPFQVGSKFTLTMLSSACPKIWVKLVSDWAVTFYYSPSTFLKYIHFVHLLAERPSVFGRI
jgi:hypothetical protein